MGEDYKISDVLIPLKAARHLPTIFEVPDKTTRYYEASANGFIVGFQLDAIGYAKQFSKQKAFKPGFISKSMKGKHSQHFKKVAAVFATGAFLAGFFFLDKGTTGNVVLNGGLPPVDTMSIVGLLLVCCSAALAFYAIRK